ncbi:MAG TPA: hypothetical protein ENF26_03580 [Methanomicrobia archaeon]|nr:hypothetical protein [Methanomicrobia archaeon]HEX59212.1 hypothetical protein [Methanomicrobia archaeon]
MGARSGRDHNANRAVAGNYTVTPTVTDDERDELHLAVVIKELVVVGFDGQTRTGKAEAWSITLADLHLGVARHGARPSRLSDAHAELLPEFHRRMACCAYDASTPGWGAASLRSWLINWCAPPQTAAPSGTPPLEAKRKV